MNDPRNIFVNQRANTEQAKTNKQTNNTNGNSEKQTATKPENNGTTTNNTDYNNMSVDERKKMLTELASKYQKEGEAQLIKDILSNVIDQKAKGQLSNEQLREFSRRVMPLLNGEQRTRLSALLEQLLQL